MVIYFNFYITIKYSNTLIYTNNNTNIISFKNINKNNKLNLFLNEINKFLFSLDHIFYKKIKFTGKGFKIKRKANNIIYYFNTAHINLLIIRGLIVKKLSKNKYIYIKPNLFNLFNISQKIKNIRCNNIFTKRGLRIARQNIVKKKGKN
jgi:ribosomal protein L6P/L9E